MTQQSAGSTATLGSTVSSPESPTIQSLLEDAKNMKDALNVFPVEFHPDIQLQVRVFLFFSFALVYACACLLTFPLRVRLRVRVLTLSLQIHKTAKAYMAALAARACTDQDVQNMEV